MLKTLSRVSRPSTLQVFLAIIAISLPVLTCAQIKIKHINTFSLPKLISPSGDLHIINDSSFLLPANGGLFWLNPNMWIKEPDSNHFLVSYIKPYDKNFILYSVFDKTLNSTQIWLKSTDKKDSTKTHIGMIPDGLFWVAHEFGRTISFGGDEKHFALFEFRNDSMVILLDSLTTFPYSVKIVNKNSIFISFGNKLIILDNLSGARELLDLDVNIIDFAIDANGNFIIVSDTALYSYENYELKVLAPGLSGRIFIHQNNLFVFDIKNFKIYSFTLSS